jgi:hypothetical protein
MSILSLIYILQQSNTNVAVVVTVAARNSTSYKELEDVEQIQQNSLTQKSSIPVVTDDNESTTNGNVTEIDGKAENNKLETLSNKTPAAKESPVENFNTFDERSNRTNITLISWEGVDGMNSIVRRYWKGNLFCEKIDEVRSTAEDPNLPITVTITFSCKELFEKSELGTGNFIALMYGFRLAAHVYGNVDLYILCHDAAETKNDLILPWITGWFPSRPISQKSTYPISVKEACGSYITQPLAYMYNEIQHDLRKMTIGLMGIPSTEHASSIFAEKYLWSQDVTKLSPTIGRLALPNPQRIDSPPFPVSQYEVDDAVLHFRCGDLMDSKHPSFAFMKFSGYTRHISPDAKSIGILTQPFDTDTQSRKADSGQYKRDRCRVVVFSLVDYIKVHYPNAQVRIHNTVGETIALTFARMIMANQTIAGISSFGVIPAISTFGTGYIRTPDYPKAPNQWLIHPRIDELTDNVVLFDEPKRIMVGAMKGLWQTEGEKGVLEWFWNDTVR